MSDGPGVPAAPAPSEAAVGEALPESPTAPPEPPSPWRRYRRASIGVKILVYMVAGGVFGAVAPGPAVALEPLGTLFIRLLLMAAVPLVFFNLLAALTGLKDLGVLGRVGAKIMAYFVATTVLALGLGLGVTAVLRPGAGMPLEGDVGEAFGTVPSVAQILLDLVPENVVGAFGTGNVAQIVVFAVFLGVATLLLPEAGRATLGDLFGTLADAFRKLVGLVMLYGPIGIGALTAATVGAYGSQLFGPLALFLAGIWVAHVCMFAIYMGILAAFGALSPWDFLKRTCPLYATTAATCSSLASLAVALELAGRRLKLPEGIYAFTLPLGAQLNKDGTSIMLAAVLLFTAQAAGVGLDPASILPVLLIGLILSKGSAGIPGGGLVMALIYVQAFQLPPEIAVIVGGVYRLIDMGNTTINVMGDVVGTAVVAHSERGRM